MYTAPYPVGPYLSVVWAPEHQCGLPGDAYQMAGMCGIPSVVARPLRDSIANGRLFLLNAMLDLKIRVEVRSLGASAVDS